MNRALIFGTALSAIALSGCGVLDSDLQHRGTLNESVDGVVMFEDGDLGHAGMRGTTCGVTPDGGLTTDVDVEDTEEETVVDGTTNGDGAVVLTRTRNEIQVIHDSVVGSFDDPTIDRIDVQGVVNAKLAGEQIVTVDGCNVSWMDFSGAIEDRVTLDDTQCMGMGSVLDVDVNNATAYISVDGQVASVTASGMTILGQGDMLSFSALEDGVLAANLEQPGIRFLGSDGSVRWERGTVDNVVSIHELGARGWMAALTESSTGAGRLMILDAWTGDLVKEFDLPGRAEIEASGNGETIALVVDRAVHYYRLR